MGKVGLEESMKTQPFPVILKRLLVGSLMFFFLFCLLCPGILYTGKHPESWERDLDHFRGQRLWVITETHPSIEEMSRKVESLVDTELSEFGVNSASVLGDIKDGKVELKKANYVFFSGHYCPSSWRELRHFGYSYSWVKYVLICTSRHLT